MIDELFENCTLKFLGGCASFGNEISSDFQMSRDIFFKYHLYLFMKENTRLSAIEIYNLDFINGGLPFPSTTSNHQPFSSNSKRSSFVQLARMIFNFRSIAAR